MKYTERTSKLGTRRVYSFDNGYEASVVNWGYGSERGLWELAVMHSGNIIYDTPITDYVLGWLTLNEVEEICNQIAQLPPR